MSCCPHIPATSSNCSGFASPSHPCPRNEISAASHNQPTHCQSSGPSPHRLAETISTPSQIWIDGLAPVHHVSLQPFTAVDRSISHPSQADLPDTYRQASTPPHHVEHDFADHYDGTLPAAADLDTDTRRTVYPQYHPLYHGYARDPEACRVPEPAIQFAQPSLASQHPCTQGMFYQASNLSLAGNVLIDNNANNFTLNNIQNSDNHFMTILLRNTIPGAEFNSSDRNPPPRCHPGTRLKVIEQCQHFILTCNGAQKLRWVVGAAGVGKSAIMQSVAEDESNVLSDIIVGATIFFSNNGRQDGTKAVTTIAYQLAVELEPYRLYLQKEVTRDPSLLQKALSTQFSKFIIEPFIHRHILEPHSRLLILIDGLDECDNAFTQQELLELISSFCITYPTSPVVWIIASRPEPHITTVFARPKIAPAYEKEEILVDSNEAREDVERYLRDELKKVQIASIALQDLSQWPSECDFLKVAKASDGLFAYASTVIRYINNTAYGDPTSLLDDVLVIIDNGTKSIVPGKDHPMARLDALYSHIMSNIPADVMVYTRKLFLLCLDEDWDHFPFQFHCNLLGMTRNAAYGATHHVRSLARVPRPAEAANDSLEFFHKSFSDYLLDFSRSGFSVDVGSEIEELKDQITLRIIKEVPEGINLDGLGDDVLLFGGGVLKNDSGFNSHIPLSWPAEGQDECTAIQWAMYRKSMWEVIEGFGRRKLVFLSRLCMRVLTSCFVTVPSVFPFETLRDVAFGQSRRHELLKHGILRRVPLKTLENETIPSRFVQWYFRSLTTERPSTPRKFESEDEWTEQNQSTEFDFSCDYCIQRLEQYLVPELPDLLVTILDVTPTLRWVELRIADTDDGVSEWVCYFACLEGDEGDD